MAPELVQLISQVSSEQAYLSLQKLQKKLRFATTKIHLEDTSKVHILTLLDLGYSTLAINETFVQEKKIPTYNLPILISVYNANGTKNASKLIKKFTMVKLHIDDHLKSLMLVITYFSTHMLFLWHDWLKIYNPVIN